jgi:hypothetical protein
MKTFHCTHCQNLIFFENVRCLSCGHALAFLPDLGIMGALTESPDGLWRADLRGGADRRAPGLEADSRGYRLCANYDQVSVCNWVIPADEAGEYCQSCRLNRVIPDLSVELNMVAWFRLEVAKRRLLYTLLGLGLPVTAKNGGGEGLAFEFLQDSADGDAARVLTGHDNGVITINIAEADDVQRETQRTLQKEPYRTLLGHFRHESGHYFWDRLILNGPRLEAFRSLFGDERADYQQALDRHYSEGPPAHWEQSFISAYASTHPWEDWAESWAHYLHMVDALETAGAAGLALRPKRPDEPRMSPPPDPLNPKLRDFDAMIESWVSLTYVLNNLSRGLGLADSYPFLLPLPAIEKLRFIHEAIDEKGWEAAPDSARVARAADATPPDVTPPDAAAHGKTQPEATPTDAAAAGATPTEATPPDAAAAGATQPGTTPPEAAAPGATSPEAPPGAMGDGATPPAATPTGATAPEATPPGATTPGATAPAATSSAVAPATVP